MDGCSEFEEDNDHSSTFRELWSLSSSLCPWLRSGAPCRVRVAGTATTKAVRIPVEDVPTPAVLKEDGVTPFGPPSEDTPPAPSVPVPQGRLTVSVFKVASVGVEIVVLAPLALRANTPP